MNEFDERLDASGVGGSPGVDGGPCVVTPGSVAGLHVLALSVSIAPGTPVLTLLDVTTPEFMGGTGLQFSGQALSAADRRTPVGGTIQAGPFAVDAGGNFRAELPGLTVAGQANPITSGDIVADVTLIGSLCDRGRFYCGTVEGQVSQPLPLDLMGSTFTLTPVPDAQTLPAQPRINCAGTLADPL